MIEIWEKYGGVLWIGFQVFIVVGGLVHARFYLRCMDIIECYDKQCKHRMFCGRYREGITEEEAEELLEYLEQLQSS